MFLRWVLRAWIHNENYHEFGIGEIYLSIISYDNCYIYDNLKIWIWEGGMLNIHKKNDNVDKNNKLTGLIWHSKKLIITNSLNDEPNHS